MNDEDAVAKKVRDAELLTSPWEHLYIENFFPDELYRDLKAYLATRVDLDRIGEGERHDYMLIHHNKEIIDDNPLVREYYKAMWNPTMISALFSSFTMENSYHKPEQPTHEAMDFYADYDVVTRGFSYHIHPDIYPKLFTIVHFLADPGDDPELGTRLYPSTHPFPKCDESSDYEKIAKFLPNSAIIFSPSGYTRPRASGLKATATNHGYAHDSASTPYRRSIQSWFSLEPIENTRFCGPSEVAYNKAYIRSLDYNLNGYHDVANINPESRQKYMVAASRLLGLSGDMSREAGIRLVKATPVDGESWEFTIGGTKVPGFVLRIEPRESTKKCFLKTDHLKFSVLKTQDNPQANALTKHFASKRLKNVNIGLLNDILRGLYEGAEFDTGDNMQGYSPYVWQMEDKKLSPTPP